MKLIVFPDSSMVGPEHDNIDVYVNTLPVAHPGSRWRGIASQCCWRGSGE